jgi:CCR4-NOT complex subunit CAF16
MRNGTFITHPILWPLQEEDEKTLLPTLENAVDRRKAGSTLHAIALMWLAEDRRLRKEDEKQGKVEKTRGARFQVRGRS